MAKQKTSKRYGKIKAANSHLKSEIKKVRKQRDYLEKRIKVVKGIAQTTVEKVHG